MFFSSKIGRRNYDAFFETGQRFVRVNDGKSQQCDKRQQTIKETVVEYGMFGDVSLSGFLDLEKYYGQQECGRNDIHIVGSECVYLLVHGKDSKCVCLFLAEKIVVVYNRTQPFVEYARVD